MCFPWGTNWIFYLLFRWISVCKVLILNNLQSSDIWSILLVQKTLRYKPINENFLKIFRHFHVPWAQVADHRSFIVPSVNVAAKSKLSRYCHYSKGNELNYVQMAEASYFSWYASGTRTLISRAGLPNGQSSSPGCSKIFLHSVQTGSGTHSASYPLGTGGAISPGAKRPGLEANHSPPSSAKVKNTWIYTSIPPYALQEKLYLSHRIFRFSWLGIVEFWRFSNVSANVMYV
jgi:hypothetical protein